MELIFKVNFNRITNKRKVEYSIIEVVKLSFWYWLTTSKLQLRYLPINHKVKNKLSFTSNNKNAIKILNSKKGIRTKK
jgi:hypothetical protein